MRHPIEIRQVDVPAAKARKIGERSCVDGRRFSVLEPKPNDVLNAANYFRLRLLLSLLGKDRCWRELPTNWWLMPNTIARTTAG